MARNLSPEMKHKMLEWAKSTAHRKELVARYEHTADLAQQVDPGNYIRTPAVDLIAEALERVIREPKRNLAISMPPQEGKSTTAAVWGAVRALQVNPDTKIIVPTYAESLALEHSVAARTIIETHGKGAIDPITGDEIEDKLGLSIRTGKGKMSSWGVNEGRGGLVAVGLQGGTTGRPADLMIIDDPYAGPEEADSITQRRKVWAWFQSVVNTRLSPAASLVVIQTRWHPEDLIGMIMAQEAQLPRKYRTWKYINIPAVAEPGIKDSLGREPGVPMESTRDTDEAQRDFPAQRRKVGERFWYAMYQGSPTPLAGGIFAREWFDRGRVKAEALPARPAVTIVAIDPADSGKGDETGLIAACGSSPNDVYLVEDWSDKLTADKWARKAIELALKVGASEIAMESYAAAETYERILRRAWRDLWELATAKHAAEAELSDNEKLALGRGELPPFTIHRWTRKGDALVRSGALRQAMETGHVHTVEGKLDLMEAQAIHWQEGQHQPDRVAAAVIAHSRVVDHTEQAGRIATPHGSLTQGSGGRNVPATLKRRLG